MPSIDTIRTLLLVPVSRTATLAAVSSAAGGVLFIAVGCAAQAVERERVGMFDPTVSITETPLVTLDRPELGSFLEFAAPEVDRLGDEMRVSVPVTNAGPYRYIVSARFFYYDEDGQELERSPARTLRLEPGQSAAFRSVSTARDAEDWRAHISWAD